MMMMIMMMMMKMMMMIMMMMIMMMMMMMIITFYRTRFTFLCCIVTKLHATLRDPQPSQKRWIHI